MKASFFIALTSVLIFSNLTAVRGEFPVSGATEECLGCHATLHPGIVESWKKSRHGATTPGQALTVEGLERRVTGQAVPDNLKNVVVGCAECHSLNPGSHQDTFDHNGYDIHVVVSPKDCAVCHTQEGEQYDRNLMAHAHGILVNNDVYRMLVQAVNETPVFERGKVITKPSNALLGF